ncbi:MAG: bis(5'-nucleosyl)-tetraphosphatase (symmetrical) YqeK [Mycoplasmataceae bacterium]|jgi:nicotinate-nucleotide adenylyltransferase|nr:bis(5'-nucleosyl)-tetraphosphatase (symmetrical) YqeK [Mycoplasmataceae bacterium]
MHLYNDLRKKIKKILSKYRYEHTLSVAEYAYKLAIIHGIDPKKAYLAGLLHDVAKELPEKDIIKLTKDDKRFATYPNVKTLHGIASAVYAKKYFNILDEDVLDAISQHVIPAKRISKLAMIIYIADKLDSQRTKYANISNSEQYRILAEKNLRKAFKTVHKILKR